MTLYPVTGPFTNGAAPGINATFLNNLETWLHYAGDSNITSDGNGNAIVVSVTFAHGKIARIAFGFAAVVAAGTTVTHNLGVVPSAVFATVSGVGSTTVVSIDSATLGTTTMKVSGSVSCNCWWLAIA